MSTIRQFNYLGQMRLDVPHFKAIESSIAYDFDVLGGKILAGNQALVVSGLTLATTNTIGLPAEDLLLKVENALIMHPLASESGTLFSVPSGTADELLSSTNSNVIGSFVSSTTHYVGIDLIREADDSTVDLAKFLDSDSLEEVSQTVPLGRVLKYKIHITTQSFASNPNLIPIAKVVTDANNNVTSITDARNLMFRLADGGDNASASSKYLWGSRLENPVTYTGTGTGPFIGEDKSISSLKAWMDSVMTSLWEVRGGERWYSSQNSWNIKVTYGPVVTLTDNWVFDTVPNPDLLKWEAVRVTFENAENSGVYYNIVTDNTTGVSFNTDGLCLYIDVVRESNATIAAQVGTLQTVGNSSTPGRRYILAWRVNGQVFTRDRAFEIGRNFSKATNTTYGVVKLDRADVNAVVIGKVGGTITPGATDGLTINAPSSGNHYGLMAFGKGGQVGIIGIGGDTGGSGGQFAGGGTSGFGLEALGAGTGYGIQAIGGDNLGVGAYAIYARINDDSTDGTAIYSLGKGTGAGISAKGGDTSGIGVDATGGASNGTGVKGTGGGTNGIGVDGHGTGTGAGVKGTGGGTNGIGVDGTGVGTGYGVSGTGSGTALSHGVYGSASAASTGGVYGTSGHASGAGVIAKNTSTGFALQVDAGHAWFAGGNPSATTGFANTMTPKNVPKAWGHITTGGSPAVVDGFNLDSTTPVACAAGDVTIKFKTPMFDGKYSVVLTDATGTADYYYGIKGAGDKIGASFKISGRSIVSGTGAAINDFNSSTYHILFVVFAAQ